MLEQGATSSKLKKKKLEKQMMIINWIRAIQFTFFPKQTQDLTTSCSCTIFFQSLLFSHDWVTKVYQKKQNYFSFPFMKDRRLHLLFTDLGINDQVPVPNSSFRKILIIWLCHLSKKNQAKHWPDGCCCTSLHLLLSLLPFL